MINAIKQASAFRIVQDGQRLAGLLIFISDVHSLGLEAAQGLLMASAYYWDQNEKTRAWAKRFFSKMQRMPTMVQGAITHYLKAVQAAGSKDPVAKMREMPINDFMTHHDKLRIDVPVRQARPSGGSTREAVLSRAGLIELVGSRSPF